MPQVIINPDANPETTSIDGSIYKNDSNSWATAQGAATGSGASDSFTEDFTGVGLQTGGNYFIWRLFFLFDLSPIPSGSVITSGSFEFYVTQKLDQDNDSQAYIALVGSTPASNTALVADDYDQLGTTKLATDIDIGSITTSTYNTWTLNASGISAIQTAIGGVAKLGLREGHDLENAAYASGQNTFSRVGGYMADNGSNKPKLTINYTPPSGGFPIFFGNTAIA